MKKRSEAVALRKRSEAAPSSKPSAEERTEPLPLDETGTLTCSACDHEGPAKGATRRADGKLECPECGAPCELVKGGKPKDEPEPIPDAKAPLRASSAEQSASPKPATERPPKATEPLPPCYCIDCGAEWPRVDERPFPNCGHTEGFVHDRSKCKAIKPPAGHPRPPVGDRPPPQPTLPPSAPMLKQGNTLHVAIGKMTFRLGDYGVNLVVGGFEATVELAPGADRVTEGAKVLADLKKLADTAFAEQLAWYASRLDIIDKKLNG